MHNGNIKQTMMGIEYIQWEYANYHDDTHYVNLYKSMLEIATMENYKLPVLIYHLGICSSPTLGMTKIPNVENCCTNTAWETIMEID